MGTGDASCENCRKISERFAYEMSKKDHKMDSENSVDRIDCESKSGVWPVILFCVVSWGILLFFIDWLFMNGGISK